MKNDTTRIFLKYGVLGSVMVHGLLVVAFFIYAAEQNEQKEKIPENISFNTDIIDSEQLALLLSNQDEDAVSIGNFNADELSDLLQQTAPPEEPVVEEPQPEVVEEEPEIVEEPQVVAEELKPEIVEEPQIEEAGPEIEIESPVIELPEEEIVEAELEEFDQEPEADEIEMTMLVAPNQPEKPKAPASASKEEIQNKFNALLKNLNTKPKMQRNEKRTDHRALATHDAVKGVIKNNANLFSQKQLKLKWKIPALSPVLQRVYFPQVDGAIKKYWRLPPSLDPTLENIVKVIIAKDGKVVSTDFLETSGNPIFDQFVKKVFKQLNKLPPLPERFPGKWTEISLRFTPAKANTN